MDVPTEPIPKATAEVRRMPIADFVRLGFLQEINRRYLHPLGLALEVELENGEPARLGGVWDYRHDPEGLLFSEEDLRSAEVRRKADEFSAHLFARYPDRIRAVGAWVQPLVPPRSGDVTR